MKTTLRPKPNQKAAYIAQAADPDGAVSKVEWDTDDDGAFDDATGASIRLGLPAGVRTIGVRVTDEKGAQHGRHGPRAHHAVTPFTRPPAGAGRRGPRATLGPWPTR